MRQALFPAGRLIFGRGDPGDALYLVLSGRVRLSILTPEGRELSFAHAMTGDIFGEIAVLDRQLMAWHAQSEASRRLSGVPGLGILTATALAATVTDPNQFHSGRQFAAWLGLTPQQHSTGGKVRLGGRQILNGLEGTLSGRTIGLLGPNGAGKSTLINTLLGFYPPSQGTARLLGCDIRRERNKIRGFVGYMPENDSFIGNMSAAPNDPRRFFFGFS